MSIGERQQGITHNVKVLPQWRIKRTEDEYSTKDNRST